ncbi:MAG: IMP cyclohydrolase [Candidatus Hydrogenedentes bacterium]|nr:IMP cyclohydrolase [Candidatus Hydrogenedentota bacterium]MBI3117091.1 IMP cyclohydrolase [Candidatus Hydrogenedentota bacterium]
MYIGRIVAVAQTTDGRLGALYRVSSRSFPNRTAVVAEERVSIVPKPGHELDVQKNPYIAYNCVRVVCSGEVAVATNGSQTDAIAEKMEMGMPARDALALTHLALDYEKDQYNTPRVSAVVDKVDGSGWLAIVRDDGLEVRRMPLTPGRFFYVATYEENHVRGEQSGGFEPSDAPTCCAFMLGGGVFAERTHAITAVAALANEDGFTLHVQDASHA